MSVALQRRQECRKPGFSLRTFVVAMMLKARRARMSVG
jgi:hypothetical protein